MIDYEKRHLQKAIDSLPPHLNTVWSKLVLGGYEFVFFYANPPHRQWKCLMNGAEIATDDSFTALLYRMERNVL